MTAMTDASGAPEESPWPVAVARLVDSLDATRPDQPGWVAEPKWDGYRAVWAGGQFYSRRGVNLTRYFPDLASTLNARLPASAVVDGEIVCWDTTKGRLDFAGLQARLSAGRRINAVAARRPAQLVAFDLLSNAGQDVRPLPLSERRRQLSGLLAGLMSAQSAPIVVCQQTGDVAQARDWLSTLTAEVGIEGLVVKNAAAPYPTRSGQRIWQKVRVRRTLDLVALGVTGELSAPTTLVLALPSGPVGPVVAGTTTQLPRATARVLAPLLRPTGRTVQQHMTSTGDTASVHVIMPLVVEVSADVAIDDGLLHHPAKLLRVRPDLTVPDLDIPHLND